MIFAKCICEKQIATSKDDFIKKQPELKKECKHIYYPGETTQSHNGQDILSCVPLNLIYDCLKYGLYIAIVERDYDTSDSYHIGTPTKNKIDSSRQKIIKIMNADCKETIDFVFDEVKDPSLISTGNLYWLSEDNRNYFKMKLNIK